MTVSVLGIAGGTASGKSTLAQAVARELADTCVHITHDSYYRTLAGAELAKATTHNFDHPDSLDTNMMASDIRALRDGGPCAIPSYDFARHRRTSREDWLTLTPRPLIVVEGILVLSEPVLRNLMTHTVFVTAPPDIRLARRIRRDICERGRECDDVLTQYLSTVRPMHEQFVEPSMGHADLVLDGTKPIRQLVHAVLTLLKTDAP